MIWSTNDYLASEKDVLASFSEVSLTQKTRDELFRRYGAAALRCFGHGGTNIDTPEAMRKESQYARKTNPGYAGAPASAPEGGGSAAWQGAKGEDWIIAMSTDLSNAQ